MTRKQRHTKLLAVLMCVVLAMPWSLAGCTGSSSASSQSAAANQNPVIEQSSDEIGTYEAIDPSKTQLVIGISGTDNISQFVPGFAAAYPDIQPIVTYLQIGDSSYSPANEWVRHGYAPDIVINLDLGQDASTYQVDLTDMEATGRYSTSSLTELSEGGRVYSLPGPSKVMAIAYNKTLFERYGWQTPQTFDELMQLCDQITADTGGSVIPLDVNAKYLQDYIPALEGFSYGQVLSGVDNTAWYNSFLNGNATFKGHMEPFFSMTQQLIDHKILTESSFDYSYTARTNQFLSSGTAMVTDYVDSKMVSTDGTEIAYMPFPSTNGSANYVTTRNNFTVCETTRNRTDAQKKAASEFLDYISTAEVQETASGTSLTIPHINGATYNGAAGGAAVSSAIADGRLFERFDFSGEAIPSTVNVLNSIRTNTLNMAKGQMTVDQATSSIDKLVSDGIADPQSAAAHFDTVTSAAQDFTVLQTSEFIADMFRSTADAQIALIPNNSIYRGNIHRIFAGDISSAVVTNMLPRSFANGTKLVKAQMTGQQLLDALNDPPGYENDSSDCIYAFSGLKATVKPCNDAGSKYQQVTLADNSQIDPAATYSVAFWQGMVKDKYITSTTQTFDGSYTKLLSSYMEKSASISPSNDDRLTLVWK